MADVADATFPITNRNRVKRTPDRGRFDKATVYNILDSAMVAHISYVIDGQPFCTPTGFWREDDKLYWHGSSASRMIRAESPGVVMEIDAFHLDLPAVQEEPTVGIVGDRADAERRGDAIVVRHARLQSVQHRRLNGPEHRCAHDQLLLDLARSSERSLGARDFPASAAGLTRVSGACNKCHTTFRVPVKVGPEDLPAERDAE